jgi:hypothetical protein
VQNKLGGVRSVSRQRFVPFGGDGRDLLGRESSAGE